MAKAFISDQQLEQLLQQSVVDLTEAMKYFPEAARNIQVKQATEAVKSGDKGKLQDLKNQYPSSEMQNLVSALQNRQNVQRLAQTIPVIQKIDDKKEKGEALSPRETNILAQKSAWVDWAKNRYPQAFKESEKTNANDLQKSPENKLQQTVTPTEKAPQAQMPQSKQSAPKQQQSAQATQQPPKQEASQAQQQMPKIQQAPQAQQQMPKIQQAPQAQMPQQTVKVPLSEEKPLSPEEMKAEVQKGTEIHSALKEGITEPDKQQADLAEMQEAFNVKTSDGSNGYFDKAPVNKDDLKSIDSSKIFEKGLSRLEKVGSGKNPEDLMFQVMELALLAPIDMATEWLNQVHANMKENDKIRQSKRHEFIDANLRNNGLSMPKLAAILAHDTQEWLLNDPAYKKIPAKGPYSKYEEALKEKRDFAAGLPKNEKGAIDFNKMTRTQKKRYTTYMTHYAQVPPFKNVAYEATGLALMGKELKEMASQAAKMQTVQVAQHQQQAPQTQEAPVPKAAAPKTAQTSEQAKLRDEALQAANQLDPLDKVTVKGNLKNPVVELPNGTKVPVNNENKDKLTAKAQQLETKKRDNDEKKQQIMQQQRQLSNARNGAEKSANTQMNIRNNNSREN